MQRDARDLGDSDFRDGSGGVPVVTIGTLRASDLLQGNRVSKALRRSHAFRYRSVYWGVTAVMSVFALGVSVLTTFVGRALIARAGYGPAIVVVLMGAACVGFVSYFSCRAVMRRFVVGERRCAVRLPGPCARCGYSLTGVLLAERVETTPADAASSASSSDTVGLVCPECGCVYTRVDERGIDATRAILVN